MNRRNCLGMLGAVGVAGFAGSGCGMIGQRFVKARKPEPLPPASDVAIGEESRLLNRAGFGIAPGDPERVVSTGRAAWVDEQLAAPVAVGVPSLVGLGAHHFFSKIGDDPGDESNGLLFRLAGIEALHWSTYEERDWHEPEVRQALTQAALLRAVYSKWQLRERMVAFWSDHFNIYGPKVIDFGGIYAATTHLTYYLNADQTTVMRQHALGNFPDLLQASAHSPAMLGYLDNQISKKGVANENYAREIMELHTLGIGGGYTQKDVQEVARCLTGWTVEARFAHRRGTFRFDPDHHDNGEKIVLGHRIPGHRKDPENDGVDVLRILAHHPSTARFISRKLVRHFLGSEDPAWIDRLASIYTATGGDIKLMLRPMLVSDDLINSPQILKRPWDYLASALRATGADTNAGADVQTHLENMGQPLFEWPMPNGYPEKTTAWTGSLLARWNFAFALCSGGIKGTSLPDDWAKAKDTHRAAAAVLGSPSEAMTHALQAATSGAEAMALAVASPEFQWR